MEAMQCMCRDCKFGRNAVDIVIVSFSCLGQDSAGSVSQPVDYRRQTKAA